MRQLLPWCCVLIVCAFQTIQGARTVEGGDLKPVTTVKSVNGVCSVVLEASVEDSPFPAAGKNIKLRSPIYTLREANGFKKNLPGLVGPILRVGKGDTLRILIKNRLKADLLPTEPPDRPENYPMGYAVTNLHTHGLHVSPSGMADNVYQEIKPNDEHQFIYQILEDHPAGTFWYHPHKHGAVALQLTGGMAGALIVDGDLDEVEGIKGTTEQILVLQQFHGKLDPNTQRLIARPEDIYDKLKNPVVPANADAKKSGPVPSRRIQNAIRKQEASRAFKAKKAAAPANAATPDDDCPQPEVDASADKDQEWLLVNGQFTPTIHMQPGEIQRLRFVHAGLDEVIKLAVVGKDGQGNDVYTKLQEIAVDGLPRGKMVSREHYLLYPGYRWDALIQAPMDVPQGTSKTLCLVSDGALAGETLSGFPTDRLIIAKIVVAGEKKNDRFPTGDALARCVPPSLNSPITDREVGNRRWSLKFDFPDHDKSVPSQLLINGGEFTRKIDRFVRLNTAEEWRIESGTGANNGAGHPFHIHVNPFLHYVYRGVLALRIANPPDGSPVKSDTPLNTLGPKNDETLTFSGTLWNGDAFSSATTVKDGVTLANLASELSAALNKTLSDSYAVSFDDDKGAVIIRALRGTIADLSVKYVSSSGDTANFSFTRDQELVDKIWRDTLMAPTGRTEVVRMRFRDWTGDTVLHCHIVDHEDQGMMKNLRILGPDDPTPQEGVEVGGHGKREKTTSRAVAAPDFALLDVDGNTRTFREFTGKKVILVFFRGSTCLPCSRQLRAFLALQDRLKKAGITLVAVSSAGVDDLRAARAMFAKGEKLPFTLLSDPNRIAFNSYGCRETGNQEPLHGTFVIDPAGVIRWRQTGDEPYMDVEGVLEEAEQIQIGQSVK